MTYDGVKIFENVNLRVSKGDKIAIVGDSGAGKTSILYIMMGILTITGKCLLE